MVDGSNIDGPTVNNITCDAGAETLYSCTIGTGECPTDDYYMYNNYYYYYNPFQNEPEFIYVRCFDGG